MSSLSITSLPIFLALFLSFVPIYIFIIYIPWPIYLPCHIYILVRSSIYPLFLTTPSLPLFLPCPIYICIVPIYIFLNNNKSYLPESWNLLEASFLVHRAPFFRPKCLTLRGHVTVLTTITWQQKFTVDGGGELIPLVAVHGRLSYFNFDGFSHLSL